MKRMILFFAILFVGGCTEPVPQKAMTNEEIVAEKQICDKAGMDVRLVGYMGSFEIIAVHCAVKEQP